MRRLSQIIGLISICLSNSGQAQLIPNGSFENGALPSTNSNFPPEILDPAIALPKWSMYGSPLYYGAAYLGGPVIMISSTSATPHGTNSIFLQAGFGGATTPVSIWQTLSIPAFAKSITFQSKPSNDPNFYPPGYYLTLLVSVAGVSVNPSYLSTDSIGFNTYAVDVAGYAGSSMELKFSVGPANNIQGGGAHQIDNIRFSSSAVPEPNTVSLFGLFSLMFGFGFLRSKGCFFLKKKLCSDPRAPRINFLTAPA